VKRAVTARGRKLILVDPRRIKIAEFAHKWLRPNLGRTWPGSNGLMQVIIAEKRYAEDYVTRRTTASMSSKSGEKYTPDRVERITGFRRGTSSRRRSLRRSARGSILNWHGNHPTHHRTAQRQVPGQPSMLCGNVGIVAAA